MRPVVFGRGAFFVFPPAPMGRRRETIDSLFLSAHMKTQGAPRFQDRLDAPWALKPAFTGPYHLFPILPPRAHSGG